MGRREWSGVKMPWSRYDVQETVFLVFRTVQIYVLFSLGRNL